MKAKTKSSPAYPFLLVVLLVVRNGVLVLQRAALASRRALGSFHIVTHGRVVSDGRGRTVTRESLRRARVLVAALQDVALMLASLRRVLLLALGDVSGPCRVQCQ